MEEVPSVGVDRLHIVDPQRVTDALAKVADQLPSAPELAVDSRRVRGRKSISAAAVVVGGVLSAAPTRNETGT